MTVPQVPFSLLHGEQTWQTFRDDQNSSVFPRIIHGSWAERYDELRAENEAGAGIFFAVNEGNGRGRKAEDIVAIRAWYTDLDGISAPAAKRGMVRRLLEHPTGPSAIVETRSGLHGYWFALAGVPLDLAAYRDTEEGLISHWGGDPSVKDVARVLRVPGLVHAKRAVGAPPAEPFLIRVLYDEPSRLYAEEEIRAAFPPPVRSYRPDHDRSARVADGGDDWSKVVDAIAAWNPVPMARHRVITLAAGIAIKFSISEGQCVRDLEPIVVGWDTGRQMDVELARTARWAYQRGDAATVKALRSEGVPVPPLSRPAD